MAGDTASSTGVWIWRGDQLHDHRGTVIADVRTDVIRVGTERLLIEVSAGPMQFRARATTQDGRVFTMRQRGWTVDSIAANCAGAEYRLNRVRAWRKDRRITLADGRVAARTQARLNGTLEVHDGAAIDDLPRIDAVFLTWGCVLIDLPARNTRI